MRRGGPDTYCKACRRVSSKTLLCQGGSEPHEWVQEHPGKGRPPKACPDHRADRKVAMRREWNAVLNANRSAQRHGHAEAPEKGLSWRKVAERDGMNCRYCGVLTVWKHEDRKLWPTLDHVIALSKGGAHTLANSVLACFSCNARKGNRSSGVADIRCSK